MLKICYNRYDKQKLNKVLKSNDEAERKKNEIK